MVREFILSSKGIELVDVYTGGGTVLTGAARMAQEASELAEKTVRQQQVARLRRESLRGYPGRHGPHRRRLGAGGA